MSNTNEEQDIFYSINYIKQIHFHIDESAISIDKGEILVQINAVTGFNLETNILRFVMRAWYYHKDDPAKEVASTEVENLFFIQNLKRFIRDDKTINFPGVLWVNIVGLSISHTRALFTKSLAGTALQNVMIPIMNPYDVAKLFYPEAFVEIDAIVEPSSE